MATVVYYTVSGQTRRFVNKIHRHKTMELDELNCGKPLDEDFILVVPAYEKHVLGEVYYTCEEFLTINKDRCRGIFASGNINFSESLFCITGIQLSEKFNIPVLHKFEFQGSPFDVEKIQKELDNIG